MRMAEYLSMSKALATLNTQLNDLFRGLTFNLSQYIEARSTLPRIDMAVGLLNLHAQMKTARQMGGEE